VQKYYMEVLVRPMESRIGEEEFKFNTVATADSEVMARRLAIEEASRSQLYVSEFKSVKVRSVR
jgi:hypothetical protein